jgi:hypothetical protein
MESAEKQGDRALQKPFKGWKSICFDEFGPLEVRPQSGENWEQNWIGYQQPIQESMV